MSKFEENIDKIKFGGTGGGNFPKSDPKSDRNNSRNPDDFSHLAEEVPGDLGAADDKKWRW